MSFNSIHCCLATGMTCKRIGTLPSHGWFARYLGSEPLQADTALCTAETAPSYARYARAHGILDFAFCCHGPVHHTPFQSASCKMGRLSKRGLKIAARVMGAGQLEQLDKVCKPSMALMQAKCRPVHPEATHGFPFLAARRH